MWRRPLRAAVRRGLADARLRRVVEAELKARRPARLVESGAVGQTFIDRHGRHHPLDPELRDRLKPGWRTLVDPVASAQPPSDDALRARSRKATANVADAVTVVAATTGVELRGQILEVGCYDGAAAYQLARRPDTVVTASDLARYYAVQSPGASIEGRTDAQHDILAALRSRARALAVPDAGPVTFVEDDITTSSLPSASLDAVISFEVLEHVQRPAEAFAGMARLLRPGGVMYHDYNPFFSINGGHSPCTLAFPWGHARLDADDVERYLRELRPTEVDQALRFYRESLNRMTMHDLRAAIDGAGLELCALIPWYDRRLTTQLDPTILTEVRRTYPSATVQDLLGTFVSVIARRPAGDGTR